MRDKIDEREPKLPKWAQQKIESLRHQLEQAEAKLAAGPEDSNTFADAWTGEGRPLGKDAKITFQLDTYDDMHHHHKIYVRLDRNRRSSYLYIMGGDSIVVEPQSSNVVRIHLERLY